MARRMRAAPLAIRLDIMQEKCQRGSDLCLTAYAGRILGWLTCSRG
jgi:hypothetical protein